ncbi:hypothetical protein AHAS_Ahas19G0185100 [Arachis hypogaea]
MRYCPIPQNDSCHYANGGWEYQQEMIEYEHLPETQNESYFDESNNYSYCDWEGQNQRDFTAPYSIHQETSSLHYAFNEFMQDFSPMPQNDQHSDEFYNDSHYGWRIKTRKHSTVHTPLIKSHHHLSKPLIHSCKIVQPHHTLFHLKILYHLTMPQHKIFSIIHASHLTNHKIHFTTQETHFNIHKIRSTIHKIHSIPLKKTSPQHILVHKIFLNLHLLSQQLRINFNGPGNLWKDKNNFEKDKNNPGKNKNKKSSPRR